MNFDEPSLIIRCFKDLLKAIFDFKLTDRLFETLVKEKVLTSKSKLNCLIKSK